MSGVVVPKFMSRYVVADEEGNPTVDEDGNYVYADRPQDLEPEPTEPTEEEEEEIEEEEEELEGEE